jgi:hypothetical protein
VAVATRGDLKRHVAAEMGLDLTTTPPALEDGLLNDWAQDAVFDFLIETRVRLVQSTITLSAGQQDYSMATAVPNVLGVTEAYLSSGTGRYGLERVKMDEIIERRRANTALDRVRKYAVEGDLLMVYPTPQSADTIILYGPLKPTPFADDTSNFTTVTYGGIPIQHDTALLAYIRWRAAIYDERRLPHTPDQYRQFYGLELVKARKRNRRMGGRITPGLRSGYPATGSAGDRNDTYP